MTGSIPNKNIAKEHIGVNYLMINNGFCTFDGPRVLISANHETIYERS